MSTRLALRFKKIDRLKAQLAAEEQQLKTEIKVFSKDAGYCSVLRPEQVRSMIRA